MYCTDMISLDIALEKLDSVLESLINLNNTHFNLSIINESYYFYEVCEYSLAMEGFIDKFKSRFSKNKNNNIKIKNISSDYDYASSPVVENTAKLARVLAKTINPFDQYVPLTLSWVCTTNIEEINELYKKKNSSFDILDISSYNLDRIQTESGFAFLFYDKKTKSIRQKILNREIEDIELQNLIGMPITDICDECLMDTLLRILRKETYEKFIPLSTIMGYSLCTRFDYDIDVKTKTAVLKGVQMDEDYLVGLSMSQGISEVMWSPNKFTSLQIQNPVIKQLIREK